MKEKHRETIATLTPKRGRPSKAYVAAINHSIVRNAQALFFRKGYSGASMEEIANLAQVSKTTLYARFPEKSELFVAILQENIAAFEREWPTPNFERGRSLADWFAKLAVRMTQSMLDPQMLRMIALIEAESGHFPELERDLRRLVYRPARERLTSQIEQAAKHFRVALEDPELLASMLIAMLWGWVRINFHEQPPASSAIERIARQGAQMLLKGALAS